MAKIGIIGAMELEVDALKAAMEVKNTVTRAGMEFKEGGKIITIKDLKVIVKNNKKKKIKEITAVK